MSCFALPTWKEGSRHPGPPVQDKPCWNAAFWPKGCSGKLRSDARSQLQLSLNVSNIRQRTTWPSLLWALCFSHPPSSGCSTHLPFSAPSARATLMLCCSPTRIAPHYKHLHPPVAPLGKLTVLPLPSSLPFLHVLSSPLLWSLPSAKAWFPFLLHLPGKIDYSQGIVNAEHEPLHITPWKSFAAALYWGRQCCHLQYEVGGSTCLKQWTMKSCS